MFRFLKTQKRLEDLEETLEKLESSQKKLELEWLDTYEKFRHLNFRVAKRLRVLEEAEEDSREPGDANGGEGTPEAPGGLSPRQRELQMKILARRMRGPREA